MMSLLLNLLLKSNFANFMSWLLKKDHEPLYQVIWLQFGFVGTYDGHDILCKYDIFSMKTLTNRETAKQMNLTGSFNNIWA